MERCALFPLILKEVRRCAARVIAMSGDSRLVFVGRSPEALFDYLAASSGFGRGEGTRGFIGSVLRDYRGYSLVSSGDG